MLSHELKFTFHIGIVPEIFFMIVIVFSTFAIGASNALQSPTNIKQIPCLKVTKFKLFNQNMKRWKPCMIHMPNVYLQLNIQFAQKELGYFKCSCINILNTRDRCYYFILKFHSFEEYILNIS